MNQAAVEWLESRPISYVDGQETYERAGDDDPVYFTELYNFKEDHEGTDGTEDDLSCGLCWVAHYKGELIVI